MTIDVHKDALIKRKMKSATVFLHLFLFIGAFISAFPFFWMVVTTLKPESEVYTPEIIILSKNMNLDLYIKLFTDPFLTILRFFFNSVLISLSSMFLCVTTALFAAYPLAKRKMPGKRIIFLIIIATMMVPGEVVLIGLFLVENGLRLINTYPGIFLPLAINAAIFLIIYNYIEQLPRELDEAPMIDGASLFQILLRIIFPISKPAIFSSALLSFLHAWHNFTIPYILIQTNEMYPLSVAALFFESTLYSTIRETLALATLLTIPTIVVFIATQRYFFSGITAGAIKG